MVLRFGKYVREVQPGLNYHLPYPIETVLTPKALRVNSIDIGMRLVEDLRRGTTMRDVPEESLMLTGDENIVDVDFSVFWLIKPNGVGDYLFNIQQPEGTVKAVAESAMREVVGRSNIQPILTGARQTIETGVQDLMQTTLDKYGAGIQITQVQLQKVDPPSQVIDAFRDVQAARADLERAQNEAQTYANKVVPEARGRAAQITQSAEAYREQTVAEAKGPTSRFLQVYDEYKKAPDVTRQRMYLETMERLFGGTDKIIMDSGTGQRRVPICRSSSSRGGRRPRRRREAADETQSRRRHCRRPHHRGADRRLRRSVHRLSDPPGAGGAAGPAGARGHRAGIAFQDPADRQRHPYRQAHPRSRKPGAGGDRLRPEALGGRCLRALPHQGPAEILPDRRHRRWSEPAAVDLAQLGAAPRAGRSHADPGGARSARDPHGAGARAARQRGAGVRHLGGRRAHSPRRLAGAEQPGGLSAHADRAPARSRPEFRAQGTQRAQEIRAKADRDVTVLLAEAQSKGEQTRGEGDAERNRIFAEAYGRDPDFFSFYRSMQAYEAGLRSNDTRMLLKPDSDFFRYFVDPSGKREGGAPPATTPPPGAPAR